jgi:hypothetical protein
MRLVPATSSDVAMLLPKRICTCGKAASFLCDYKIGHGMRCDSMVCIECVTRPAEHKHLCKFHKEMWEARKKSAAAT